MSDIENWAREQAAKMDGNIEDKVDELIAIVNKAVQPTYKKPSTYVVNFLTDLGRTEIYVEAFSCFGAIMDVLDRYDDARDSDSVEFIVRKVQA